MNTNEDVLETCETKSPYVEFEERAAAMYLDFARRFRDNSELSWFWLGMSMAERQHALVLAFCECQQILGDNSSDRPDTHDLATLLHSLESRAARGNLSVDDAFLIAAEMEASEINAIYERLVGPAQGTSYLTRKKIETLNANHPEVLFKAAGKFGVSTPVLEKLAQLAASPETNRQNASAGSDPS